MIESEKILGFKSPIDFASEDVIILKGKNLVRVVSKHKFDREMERKNKRIKALQKGRVSLEWLKKYFDKNNKMAWELKDKEFVLGYNTALRELILSAEKEAKK